MLCLSCLSLEDLLLDFLPMTLEQIEFKESDNFFSDFLSKRTVSINQFNNQTIEDIE